jgi:hypothetical protein
LNCLDGAMVSVLASSQDELSGWCYGKCACLIMG